MKKGTRNRWFILFTNSMIDFGFVIGAFVPCKYPRCRLEKGSVLTSSDVVAAACHNGHLSTIWRTSLGIGVVFPLVLFVMRLGLKEPEEFNQYSMKHQTPYWLVLRYYWFRLLCVSLVWFLYNVSIRGLSNHTDQTDQLVLILRLWHLLFVDSLWHLRSGRTTNNSLWLEHSRQHVLPAWNYSRCLCQ